jgi:hypothetical protein
MGFLLFLIAYDFSHFNYNRVKIFNTIKTSDKNMPLNLRERKKQTETENEELNQLL